MAKTQVYLIQIMEHLSLPADGSPKGNNSENKSSASSDTTDNMPQGMKEHWIRRNNLGVAWEDTRRVITHQKMKGE